MENYKLKKYVIRGAASIIILLVLFLGLHYLTTAQITLTAATPQDTVAIAGISNKNGSFHNTYIKQALGHLSVRVARGTYVLSDQAHVATINKTITLKARQTFRYKFKSIPSLAPEPVTGASAADLSVNDSQLYYVDTASYGLYQINSQNNVNRIAPNTSLISAMWASPGYGVGQDYNGTLYIINGVGLTPLALPSGLDTSRLSYAISPSKQIYLSAGRDVYAQQVSGAWQKIYTAKDIPNQIAPSANYVALVTRSEGKNSSLTIITKQGRVIKSSPIQGNLVNWSPDGLKISVQSNDGQPGVILNSSLQQIAFLPNADAGDLWLNSHTLLYASGNNLWYYDVSSKDSFLLASLAPGNAINQMVLDSNKNYVYLSVSDNEGKSELERVGLKSQKAPEVAYKLDVFFPAAQANCSINYVSFASPSLLVTNNDPSQPCQTIVEIILNNDGFGNSGLQVNYVNSPEDQALD